MHCRYGSLFGFDFSEPHDSVGGPFFAVFAKGGIRGCKHYILTGCTKPITRARRGSDHKVGGHAGEQNPVADEYDWGAELAGEVSADQTTQRHAAGGKPPCRCS